MSVHFVDAFLRRIVQGLAAADPDAAVALPDADAADDAAVVTPAQNAQDTVPSDVKKHKRMPKRKREAKMHDNPRKAPKLKNASDCVPLPASAVQGNTTSINVEVPNYQAWTLRGISTPMALCLRSPSHLVDLRLRAL
ncbi:hypothetical protein FN846DRAFT_903813 [Sphaerosporella brunnea]|uniref:Uncharacterized protein n=1 Tax=Sphaerosporella brunnea TaxID=1250544 RepID=A0A5J5F6T0_9PEZI|nr:hypothetical protein FN846DRAFT_903813 [Sphaerosporella brunnea]